MICPTQTCIVFTSEPRKGSVVWMNTQPHLPHISDDFIYLFLHANYYSIEKTKTCIENYFTSRASAPAIFADRDPHSPRMQTILHLG
ncbi:hypothetical protein BDFB_003455 [Asbolus verrucosus]|uniref:Uncharacterized protein n=1 Tax=Asbolus verrucosus TaxID=1661398 RepID=A0A482W0N6_ASBVE|nr:hypothetical protein BDFB_003455 [Asbolus verrucosus]